MPALKKNQIVDEWSVLIRGIPGKAGYIFGTTGNNIDETNVPDVNVEKSKVAAGGAFGGLFAAKRDCLIITNTQNPKLRPYQMFICARDYGNNLDISWYLTYRLSFRQKVLTFFRALPLIGLLFVGVIDPENIAKTEVSNLDFFDEQDLRVYVTNAHKCLQDAVDKLMLELNQDPSKIDRKSRGFLGIS